MKVSVIVPAYNCTRYIGRCISSVKVQTYDDWECIIVDDCSTDDTYAVAKKLTRGDRRFKVIQTETNSGAPTARNLGMAKAKGDALSFIDADDWVEPTLLDYLVTQAVLWPDVGRIATPCLVHWENRGGEIAHWSITPTGLHEADSPHLFKDASCDVGHVTGNLYVKKNVPDGIYFPVGVYLFDDMIANIGLIFQGVRTVITDNYLYHYRRHTDTITISGSYCTQDANAAREAFDAFAKKYNPAPETLERCRAFMERAVTGRINYYKYR